MTNQEYKEMIHSVVIPTTLSSEEQSKRYQLFIDFLKAETPKELYRFRRCKERTIKEFDQNILSFSPAHKLNDGFDGLLYFNKTQIKTGLTNTLTPQNVGSLLEILNQGNIPVEIQNNIPNEMIQCCLSVLSKYTPDMINAIIDQFLDFATNDYDKRMTFLSQVTQNQKVASLSSDIRSPAMWGYYADDGKGFALSYDLRESDYAAYCLVPVIYGNKRLDATQYATWLFQQQVLQRILIGANAAGVYPLFQQMIPCPDNFMATKVLIHKATDWEHEKEWRLVYYERNNLGNEDFPYITKQPTGIYLGQNISSIHEKILRHIAVEKGIPVYKMAIHMDDPTYNLHPEPM